MKDVGIFIMKIGVCLGALFFVCLSVNLFLDVWFSPSPRILVQLGVSALCGTVIFLVIGLMFRIFSEE